jgi:uncharacterized protein (DUF58 family)
VIPAEIQSWLDAGQGQGGRYRLAMPSRAASGVAGLHPGLARGTSIEFQEHREYQPGDDLRHLDWSASARSDRLIVKTFREEVSPCLDLVVDGSRSMALTGSDKAQALVGLAALLCTAATATGWSHVTWSTGEVCERLDGGALLPRAWTAAGSFAAATNPGTALHSRPPRWRTRSVRVLVSDLLWPGPPEPILQRLAAGAAAVTVLRVVSVQDLVPPDSGNLRLSDVETGDELEVHLDPATAEQYRQALATHHQQWLHAARRYGIGLVTIIAEDLVRYWHPDGGHMQALAGHDPLAELIEIGLLQAAP